MRQSLIVTGLIEVIANAAVPCVSRAPHTSATIPIPRRDMTTTRIRPPGCWRPAFKRTIRLDTAGEGGWLQKRNDRPAPT